MGIRYFDNCQTLEQARNLYKEILMREHPDRGGDAEKFKDCQQQFEDFLKHRPASDFVKDMHHRQGAEARAKMQYADGFYEALSRVMAMNVDVEVIGAWIHVTNAHGMDNFKLTTMGFWWSVAHNAMIWSGDEKKHIKPVYTTDELRARYGSEEKRKKRYF